MDSEIAWFKALEDALKLYGVNLPKEYASKIYGRDWHSVYDYIGNIFIDHVPSIKKLKADTLMCYRKQDSTAMIIQESKELLIKLSQKYKIAIVSGASNQTIIDCIKVMQIENFVDFYVGYDDYSRSKPNPQCYQLAASRAGVLPEECIVFEDSEVGVASAKDAGMFCVALSRRESSFQNHSNADMILSSLGEFDISGYIN